LTFPDSLEGRTATTKASSLVDRAEVEQVGSGRRDHGQRHGAGQERATDGVAGVELILTPRSLAEDFDKPEYRCS
jgi:hypothetical protein